MKDYGGFTKDFSTQMLFGANEVELGKQWANNKIITNLEETYKPFGTLRRGDHITVLIKQTNKEIPGEFLGSLGTRLSRSGNGVLGRSGAIFGCLLKHLGQLLASSWGILGVFFKGPL